MRLSGKIAVVTGGSAGIGREIALRLSQKGAHVIVVVRHAEAAQATVQALPGPGEVLIADLSVASEQDRVVAEIAKRWPGLSILVNNAGVQWNLPDTGIGDNGLIDAFRDEISLNLTAPVALSFGLMPVLARQPEAAIVNIASGLAISPKRTAPVYCATKSALRTFGAALRYRCEDAAPTINVIDVVMAYVDTAMTRARGGAKMPASAAARQVVAGIEMGSAEVWVGKARWLRLIHRWAPGFAGRLLRNG